MKSRETLWNWIAPEGVMAGAGSVTLLFIGLLTYQILIKAPEPLTGQGTSAPIDYALNFHEKMQEYMERLHAEGFFKKPTLIRQTKVFQGTVKKLVKDYRLKGIVMLGTAEAIVEDARNQSVMMLKAGDPLGEVRVKEIKNESLVVTYLGQDYEMPMAG